MTEPLLQPPRGKPSTSRLWIPGLLVIVGVGVLLRFSNLTERELWLDESCTFYYVHNLPDWPADGPDPRLELTTLPYTVALYGWTRLTGETAWGLRSFSALTGCVMLFALALVGYRLGGAAVALMAAALLAFHPLHIHYSQEARVYALWCLEITLALFVLWRAVRTGRARWWGGYAVLALLTVVTHYHTLFWLPATICAVVLAHDRGRGFRQWLTTHVLLGLALLPVFVFLILPVTGRGSQAWLAEMWRAYPPILAIPKTLWALLPSGGYPEYVGVLPLATEAAARRLGAFAADFARWAPAVGCACLLVTWLIARRRMTANKDDLDRNNNAGAYDRTILFLVLIALTSALTPFVYSLLRSPVYIVGRYDLPALPPVVLAVAMLIRFAARRLSANPRGRAACQVVVTGLLAACGLVTVLGARAIPAENETAERVRRLNEHVGEGDLVVSVNMYRWHLAYELDRQGFRGELLSFPPAHDRQVGWENATAELAEPGFVAGSIEQVRARITKRLSEGRRVWILYHGKPQGPRFAVDQRLFAALREAGLDLEQVDEWLGLVSVEERGRESYLSGVRAGFTHGTTPDALFVLLPSGLKTDPLDPFLSGFARRRVGAGAHPVRPPAGEVQ